MKFAIDGSNVLLGLRLNRKPSVRLFAKLVQSLSADGHEIKIFFDVSIEKLMSQAGLTDDWHLLRRSLKVAGHEPHFAPRADIPIEAHCKLMPAAVINSTDKMDSWNTRPQNVYRARVRREGSSLKIFLLDDRTAKRFVQYPGHEKFQFGGIDFPEVDSRGMNVDVVVAPDSEYLTRATEGVLLVFALDASISMLSTESFDGRPKCVHLNEVIKSTIERLHKSRVAEGLYLAILRFENDVTPLCCQGEAPFSSINDWYSTLNTFNYMSGVKPSTTNIRLALQRSKELIQDALSDSESVSELAEEWRAAVVLVTDGNHVVTRVDGSKETDTDVASSALEIHQGLSGLIGGRIDVGCVGIGDDINQDLLKAISSKCTTLQKGMASRARVKDKLIEERLFIIVDSNDGKFGEAIRSFIDVASGNA